MGEVRVRVRLTNGGDAILAGRGQLPPSEVRHYETDAVVDSGAVRTVIPIDVVRQLGVAITERTIAEYADGRKDQVGLTEAILVEIEGRRTYDDALVLGDEVLIGQTVLEKLDLWLDMAGRRVIRNPAHPDQAVTKVK